MQKPTVKNLYTNMPKDEGEIISVYLWKEHRDLVIKFKKSGESYNPDDESDEQLQVGVDIMNERVQVGLRIIDF
ncbi:hypothetical protein J2D73_08070 [Acetobacter sacchari]|uniref:Uncharacterized protein n=1 Tax=Acetobacter sacchari TaxID=2661687 RepID=A0ABS3LV09_9PROT|nr:hypothetical protein [Acetobacter sacchari]MBO1359750.1 hypothetical protein [Acetobacter sacchari]